MKGLRPRGGPFESRETISFEGSGRWLESICVCKGEIGPESPQAGATPHGACDYGFSARELRATAGARGQLLTPCVPGGCSGCRPVSSNPANKLSWEPGPRALCGKALRDGGASPRTRPLSWPRGRSSLTPASRPRTSSRVSCSHCLLPPKAQGAYFCFSVGLTRDKDMEPDKQSGEEATRRPLFLRDARDHSPGTEAAAT